MPHDIVEIRQCQACGCEIRVSIGDTPKCPKCGWRACTEENGKKIDEQKAKEVK